MDSSMKKNAVYPQSVFILGTWDSRFLLFFKKLKNIELHTQTVQSTVTALTFTVENFA